MQEDFVMITGSEAEHAYTKSRTHFFILFYFILSYIYIYIYPPIWLSWCSWSLSHRQLCLNLHSDISPLNYSSHLRHRLVADPDTRLAGEPGSPQCIEGKLSLRKHTVIMMPWSFTVRLHVPALMFFTSYWGWSGCLTAHTSLHPHPEQITFPLIDFFRSLSLSKVLCKHLDRSTLCWAEKDIIRRQEGSAAVKVTLHLLRFLMCR